MDIEIEERRLSGMRYYTANPKFEAHVHTWFRAEWNEMVEWCVNSYGPSPSDGVWTPGARWYANNAKFWFREHKDLEWFVLRWS